MDPADTLGVPSFFQALPGATRRRISDWTRVSASRFGVREDATLAHWRGRILAAMLGAALLLGFVPLLLGLYIFLLHGPRVMVVVDLAAYAAAGWVLYSRSLRYRARAWSVILSMFAIGAISMALTGFRTAGAVWLSMAALTAGLLVSVRAGIAVVACYTLLFAVLGVGIVQDALPWTLGVPNALLLWTLSTVNTALIGLMATVSVGVLVSGLERESEGRLRAETERRHGQQLEALGTLAGGIAHDFNNLLAPILGNVELLAVGAPIEQQELLDDIRTSAERGRDLVRRLLSLRRGEVGTERTEMLAPVAEEVARLVRASVPQSVRIESRVTPAPAVRASVTELHQIVMNLVTNAVQAMPRGGVLTLDVDTIASDHRLLARLRVRDTGCGMNEATRARAFDPFYTTKGAQQGTGLGLATVRALVATLGGTVALTSTERVGTEVTVCLPGVYADDEGDERVRQTQRQPTPRDVASWNGTSPTPVASYPDAAAPAARLVLLVDDEPVVLESARRVMTALGFRAIAMSSAWAAEEWFAEHAADCDLVITDHRMPGRTGPEMLAAMRRQRPDLPAVVVSGYTAEAAREVQQLGGDTALLAKPYGIAELTAAIDSAGRTSAVSG